MFKSIVFVVLKVLYTIYAMSSTEKELAYPSSADRLASVSTQTKKKRLKKELCILENPVFLSILR